jgi:hypothetical protein
MCALLYLRGWGKMGLVKDTDILKIMAEPVLEGDVDSEPNDGCDVI